jgi:hypothetical protein
MIRGFGTIVVGILLSCGCRTIKTNAYFSLNENEIDRFNTYFIRSQTDSSYKKMEKLFGSISDRDTVFETLEIIYKTLNIEGRKVYYAIATTDTLNKDARIGPQYFVSSALMFENKTVRLAPAYELGDLEKLKLSDFAFKIPRRISKNDTITIVDGEKELLLCDFKKEPLVIANRAFLKCLKIKVIEKWPTTSHTGTVWLSKKYGLLKWIRSTGLVQTREF